MVNDDTIFYKDMNIKIGDKIYCTNFDENPDYWGQHLTIGKEFSIN